MVVALHAARVGDRSVTLDFGQGQHRLRCGYREHEGVDVNDDDTQEQTRPEHLEPIDAYNRALFELDIELHDLANAIKDDATELIAVGAHDAVIVWLAGDAAYQRLAPTMTEAQSLLEAAKLGLAERYSALMNLFDLAETKFTEPDDLGELTALRRTLEIAAGKRCVDQGE